MSASTRFNESSFLDFHEVHFHVFMALDARSIHAACHGFQQLPLADHPFHTVFIIQNDQESLLRWLTGVLQLLANVIDTDGHVFVVKREVGYRLGHGWPTGVAFVPLLIQSSLNVSWHRVSVSILHHPGVTDALELNNGSCLETVGFKSSLNVNKCRHVLSLCRIVSSLCETGSQ